MRGLCYTLNSRKVDQPWNQLWPQWKLEWSHLKATCHSQHEYAQMLQLQTAGKKRWGSSNSPSSGPGARVVKFTGAPSEPPGCWSDLPTPQQGTDLKQGFCSWLQPYWENMFWSIFSFLRTQTYTEEEKMLTTEMAAEEIALYTSFKWHLQIRF